MSNKWLARFDTEYENFNNNRRSGRPLVPPLLQRRAKDMSFDTSAFRPCFACSSTLHHYAVTYLSKSILTQPQASDETAGLKSMYSFKQQPALSLELTEVPCGLALDDLNILKAFLSLKKLPNRVAAEFNESLKQLSLGHYRM
ncbi:hypothetical protein Tco_0609936 [Tanacetum coccineum]